MGNRILDGQTPGWTGSATDASPLTQSDATADPAGPFRSLFVGGTGAIKLTTYDGTTVTFTGVPAGFFHVAVSRVWTTGTTATNLLGLK